MKIILHCTLLLVATTLFISCKKEDKAEKKDEIRTEDPVTRTILVDGTGSFVDPIMRYYNLETGLEVSPMDSSTNKWDLAFERVKIYMNSVYGGVTGQVLEEKILMVTEAPETGYKKDGEFTQQDEVLSDMNYRLFTNWYDYDGKFYPKNPRTYIIRTHSGKYVRLQLSGWYNPDNINEGGWFDFTYTIQPGGSRFFVK